MPTPATQLRAMAAPWGAPVWDIGAAEDGQFLKLSGEKIIGSAAPAPSAATATEAGIIKLAGDLGGSSSAPTVPGLAGKADSSHTHAESDVTGLVDDLAAKEATANKAAANGYAGLDAATKVPTAQLGGAGADATKFLRGDQTWQAPPGGGGEAFPVGSLYLAVVSTNPNTLLGYGTWASIGAGRVLVGLDSGDTDFDAAEETGGAKTVASSAQAFAGNALATHQHAAVTAGTPSGTNAAEAAHTHSVTSNVTVADHGAHVHSGSADHASHTHDYTQVVNHTHKLSTILRTATTGSDNTNVAQTVDASSTKDQSLATDNPTGGVATGTTAGPSAALTHGNTGNPTATLTHAPTNNAVTSAAGASHNHAFTGDALAAHQHAAITAGTPSGANTPGAATSVVQPYFVCYMWKRTA